MSRRSSLVSVLGHSLSHQLDRLGQTLDRLGQRLRDAVTHAVGETVGGAVRQTLHAALQVNATEEYERPIEPRYRDPPAWTERTERGERAWGEPAWNDYPGWEETDEPDRSAYSEPVAVPETESRPSAVARLVLVGCQALAWWFRGHAARRPLLAAMGVGAACGVAAYLGGPVLLTGAGLAGSALGLATLAEAARSGARALAGRDAFD